MRKVALILLFTNLCFVVFTQNFQVNWQQCFGGSETDNARDIIEFNNYLYVLGGTTSNDGDISYNHGLGDVWLVKMDSVGNIIWEKTYGGSGGETGHRILFNDENGFYILARTGSDDGDISYNPFPNSTCFWILKIDFDGNIIWEKVVGGNGADEMWTGTIASDGGVIALGYSGSEYGDVSINYGLYDIWMIKLNREGEIEWDFTMGTDSQDYGYAIIQTSDGGYLVGGSSKLTGGGNLDCESQGQADGVLVKLDADRNIEWQNCYGGSGYDLIWEIIELIDGYIFVGGAGSNDGDISGYHGGGDIWVVRIDIVGNIVWQKCLGGSRSEYANTIYKTDDDGFIIVGSTRSNDGDVNGNSSISEYDYDIWFVKLNSEGELLYQHCFGGEGSEIIQFGVVKQSDTDYVIAGTTNYGPSFDVGCAPYGGILDRDFWVFEIMMDDTTSVITPQVDAGEIKIYPNPATTELWLQLPENLPLAQAQIELYGPTGKLLYRVQLASQFHKIETAHLPAGLYLVRLWDGERWRTEKVVVE